MKTLVTFIFAVTLLLSCNKKPSASIELSDKNPKVGQQIDVSNLSCDGDLYYIKMKGAGLFDGKLFVEKSFIATQKNFKFIYSNPGTYEVEVSTESTNFLSSTETITSKYTIKVIPDATVAVH